MTRFLIALFAVATLVLIGCTASAADPMDETPFEVTKTAAQWQQQLSPMQFNVIREKGTERAFTGEFWDHHADGVYTCRACGQELYDAQTKFKSGTGWPSYWQPVNATALRRITDSKWGMSRTEVVCSRCGGHLGHVFADGPKPTGERHCINSASLDFVPRVTNATPAAPAQP